MRIEFRSLLIFAAAGALIFGNSQADQISLKDGGFNTITSVPRVMLYQAVLKDSAGDPMPDSVYNVTFRIFNTDIGGTAEWEQTLPCTTSSGLFTTIFENVNLSFDTDYWLELELGSEILDPRQHMGMSAYSARSDTSEAAIDIVDNAVTSAKIQNGTIQFIDIGSNGAGVGQIMKWNGSSWVVGNDEVGSGNGWIDDGNYVRLWASYDSVGIGTSTPDANLHVDGSVFIGSGHADSAIDPISYTLLVGQNHTNGGLFNSITGGSDNEVNWLYSHIGGGRQNTAYEAYSVIGGGYNNTDSGYYATIGGGGNNLAMGHFSAVGGGGSPSDGSGNRAYGDYSFIGGGQNNVNHALGGFIGGGTGNLVDTNSIDGVIAGGNGNRVANIGGFIGGGLSNRVEGNFASVTGGKNNNATGSFSHVGGGEYNDVFGDYSSVLYGLNNIIDATADSSLLLGNDSYLSQSSTFMVNMPHIRFGSETSGYEIPRFDGAAGQILSTNGAGQVSWTDITGGSWISEDTVVYLDPGTARVGVGISTPVEKMEVAGNIKATGSLISGNSITIDGVADRISASSGTISFDDDNIITTGQASFGVANTNSGYLSLTVGMGQSALGPYSTVTGGAANMAVHEYTTVGGGYYNRAHWEYSTVSGGKQNVAAEWYTTVGGGLADTANGQYSTIGGGAHNKVNGHYSTIGGGSYNIAIGENSTIGGGYNNSASAYCSVIPGGCYNTASGPYSMAVGSGAKALHAGSFVWADASSDEFASTGDNQVMMLASGGTWIYSDPDLISGVTIHPGASSWATYSDAGLKENSNPVNGKDILRKIKSLSINEWNYRSQSDEIRHIGPDAADFHNVFGLGDDDKTISTIDPPGIALAGMKELISIIEELQEKNAELEKRIAELENSR